MLQGVTLPTNYYSEFLLTLVRLGKTGLTFHGGSSKYAKGWPTQARAAFVAQGNTITADGGQDAKVISNAQCTVGGG
jgi:hypothetical protein